MTEPVRIERPPILVTGAHRTGTTWVGKMLAAGAEAAYISEPLNVLHRPGVFHAPIQHWYTYINEENQAVYLPALRELLDYRYDLGAELRSLRSRKDILRMGRDASIFFKGKTRHLRPLLKDPFAVFSSAWFARQGFQVVVTVRHPAGFASSLKRLKWPFNFQDLLAQPLLMHDWLEPHRREMENLLNAQEDVIAQAGLLWCMIYRVVEQVRREQPQVQVVRHEDLSLEPVAGFQRLYESLGLHFDEQVQKAIQKSSSSENPAELSQKSVHAVHLDSKANLHNWKKRLSAQEIERIRRLTEETASIFYPEIDWEPN